MTTFPVFPPPPSTDPCPNAAFRTGPSAKLPDCRAYEGSPLDKGGEDIVALANGIVPARIDQATREGGKLTYSATRPVAGAVGAPWSSQYIASRGEVGWASEEHLPAEGGNHLLQGKATSRDTPFKPFSEDLCNSWLVQDVEVPLAPARSPASPTSIGPELRWWI